MRVQCAERGPRARVPQLDRLLVVLASGGDHALKFQSVFYKALQLNRFEFHRQLQRASTDVLTSKPPISRHFPFLKSNIQSKIPDMDSLAPK